MATTESPVPRRRQQKKPAVRRIRRPRRNDPPTMWINKGALVMMLPRKLRSLNQLKSHWARYGDTQTWERIIKRAELTASDMSLAPGLPMKMRLDVVRLAPREQYFLDKTNLAGAVKGLEDALVRLGYLVDDNPKWLDGPYVSQKVSDDKKYWTQVVIRLAPSDRLTRRRTDERLSGMGNQRHRARD